MQTTLQFGNTSTIQEWTNFKGLLKNAGKAEKAPVKNSGNAELLIDHLTRQLDGSSVIKMWEMRSEPFTGGFSLRGSH